VNLLPLFACLLRGQSMDAASEPVAPASIAIDASAADAGAADIPSDIPDGALSDGTNVRIEHLRGRVLAKGSRSPIVSAKIVAQSSSGSIATSETDDDGQFDLALACEPHEVLVRTPGYEPLSTSRDPCADSSPMLLRLLPRQGLPVYETLVTARRDEPSVELRGPELTSTPGSLGDPFRVIESLPGVAAVAWPIPIYAIRGSNPGNTGYFLDDLQVPMLFHMALGPSVIHPYFFDSMQFYPGGYPARYGRYVAGVVSARTRAPAEDRWHADVDVRLYDAGALVSVPWPDHNGAVAVAFRYSYTGTLASLLSDNLELGYWDYQLRAERLIRGWKLSLFAFGSGDSLVAPGDDLADAAEGEYRTQFHRVSLRASRPAGKGSVSLQLALGKDSSTAPIVRFYSVTERAYSITPRAIYERKTDHADYEIGFDGHAQWLRPAATVNESGVSDLAANRTALLAGGYASVAVRAGSRLDLTPALRFDSYTIGGTSRTDLGPRLSARLRLADETWLSASGGRFSQAPSLGVQFPAAENFGLGLYGLQTSWQGALGLETHRVPGFEIEVTGYLQRYVLTDIRDPGLVAPNPLARDFLVPRDARSFGLEILLRRPMTELLHGWISYTLSQNQRALGSGVIGPSDWDQRHILNAVLGYRLGQYELGVRGHLNTGRPVLIQGSQAETFVRLPTFYQVDLRAERSFLFNSFTLRVYLEVVNATLTRQTFSLTQTQDGQVEANTARLFLPSLGVRGQL
jgi:hypothetical protein